MRALVLHGTRKHCYAISEKEIRQCGSSAACPVLDPTSGELTDNPHLFNAGTG
jgi:hypothetical protein